MPSRLTRHDQLDTIRDQYGYDAVSPIFIGNYHRNNKPMQNGMK